MENNEMFVLADQFKALRDEKADAEAHLKEINAAIETADYQLATMMTESETQNFTHAGVMFSLTTKTHASATADRKDRTVLSTAQRGLRKFGL